MFSRSSRLKFDELPLPITTTIGVEVAVEELVVEDLLGAAHLDPVGVALAAAVLEVEDGVRLRPARVVPGWGPHQRGAFLAGHGAGVGHALDLAAPTGGDVRQQSGTRPGDEEGAPRRLGGDRRRVRGVLDRDPVHDEPVVVEPGLQRAHGRPPPVTVAGQRDAQPAAARRQVRPDRDVLSVREVGGGLEGDEPVLGDEGRRGGAGRRRGELPLERPVTGARPVVRTRAGTAAARSRRGSPARRSSSRRRPG